MMVGQEKFVKVISIDKTVTYASGWSNEASPLLNEKTDTVSDNAPSHFQEFLWKGTLDKEEAKTRVEVWFAEKNIPMADWEKTVHVKHLCQCTVEDDEYDTTKTMEIWREMNYNGATKDWDCDVFIQANQVYNVISGFDVYMATIPYTNVTFFAGMRWVGSWVTAYGTLLFSDYPAQYKVVEPLDESFLRYEE
jgi:hypothetical protein